MHVRLKAALAGVVLSTSIVSAQQAVRPGLSGVDGPGTAAVKATRQAANAAAQKTAGDIRSLINGVAVDSNQTPLPNATTRTATLGPVGGATGGTIAYTVEAVDAAGNEETRSGKLLLSACS